MLTMRFTEQNDPVMARNIFSFIKIERKQTRMGIYASAAGAVSILCLIILMIASSVMKGKLPSYASGIGYLSFILAGFALYVSVKLWQDTDVYGPMVHTAVYVNLAAVGIHGIVFLIGCFSMLM